jgi:hypothetical protein
MVTNIFAHLLREYGDRITIETHTPAQVIQRDDNNDGNKFPYNASQNAHSGEIVVGGGDLGGLDDGAQDVHGIASDEDESLAAKTHLASVLPVVLGTEELGGNAEFVV